MGKRGPQPGFRKRQQEEAMAQAAAAEKEGAETPLSLSDRENPDKLSGDALRELGHRHGLARSQMASMDDAKVRRELNYLIHRQYAGD
jgi:hypothetical protein